MIIRILFQLPVSQERLTGNIMAKPDCFTGWMLLNYNKPVQVSSTLGGYLPNNAVDELAKTYWSAATANKGEWIQTDLGNVSTVNAVQINYADQDVDLYQAMENGTGSVSSV